MNKHRLFVAINLPEKIRDILLKQKEKWPHLPARWAKAENIHITLVFLGYVSNEEIPNICRAVKEAAGRSEPFSINLNRIVYGPPKKMPPRMVWIEGKKNEKLSLLKNDLEEALLKTSIKGSEVESRLFSPHITLGRIKTWQWKQIEPEERPEINEDMDLTFEVENIDIMESFLKKQGPEYIVLDSYVLGQEE